MTITHETARAMQSRALQDYATFAWQPAKSRSGGAKAVWTGEGQRDPLYGQDAIDALDYDNDPVRRTTLDVARSIGDKASRAIGEAKRQISQGVNEAGKNAVKLAKRGKQNAITVDRVAGKVAASVGEYVNKYGMAAAKSRALRWATEPLSRFLSTADDYVLAGSGKTGIQRSKRKLKLMRNRLRDSGLVKGLWKGAHKLVVPYWDAAFRANTKKYNRATAHVIEAASFVANLFLGAKAKAAAGAGAAYGGAIIGSAFGPVGSAIGATIGGLAGTSAASWGVKGVGWLGRQIAGGAQQSGSAAGNSVGRTLVTNTVDQADRLKRRVLGQPRRVESDVRQRKSSGGILKIGQYSKLPHIARKSIRQEKKRKGDSSQRVLDPELERQRREAAEATKAGIMERSGVADRIGRIQRWLGFSEKNQEAMIQEIIDAVKRTVRGARAVARMPVEEISDEQVLAMLQMAGKAMRKAGEEYEAMAEFTAFGFDDWTQIEGGKWRSPGGRVLSDRVFQLMKSDNKKPTAKQPKQIAAPSAPKQSTRPPAPAATKRSKTNQSTPASTSLPNEVSDLYERISKPEVSESDVQSMVDRIKQVKDKATLHRMLSNMQMSIYRNETSSQIHERIEKRLLNVKRSAIKSTIFENPKRHQSKASAETPFTITKSQHLHDADAVDYSSLSAEHRDMVARAIAKGRKVSPEVLADYPDLASKYVTAPQSSINRAEIDLAKELYGRYEHARSRTFNREETRKFVDSLASRPLAELKRIASVVHVGREPGLTKQAILNDIKNAIIGRHDDNLRSGRMVSDGQPSDMPAFDLDTTKMPAHGAYGPAKQPKQVAAPAATKAAVKVPPPAAKQVKAKDAPAAVSKAVSEAKSLREAIRRVAREGIEGPNVPQIDRTKIDSVIQQIAVLSKEDMIRVFRDGFEGTPVDRKSMSRAQMLKQIRETIEFVARMAQRVHM